MIFGLNSINLYLNCNICTNMKIILAIDSFKGCLTSEEVEDIVSSSLKSKEIEIHKIPMSDGGEGMLEAFISAMNGKIVESIVHDPLMRQITAQYGITPDGTAVIETAKACGLTLMSKEERNPMIATTYGVGELIIHALHAGCRNFIIGLGGSGTSDAGRGMLKAISDSFPYGRNVKEIIDKEMNECRFTLASDVRNPLCGNNGAAYIFAPQKGATEEMVIELDRRAKEFAEASASLIGEDNSNEPGAGAAGGLGYAFLQYFNATFKSGADLLLELTDFDSLLNGADMVITGEGHADSQTLMGKLPERILRHSQKHNVPVWLIAGRTDDCEKLLSEGFDKVYSITPDDMPTEEAVKPDNAIANIKRWTEAHLLPLISKKID